MNLRKRHRDTKAEEEEVEGFLFCSGFSFIGAATNAQRLRLTGLSTVKNTN